MRPSFSRLSNSKTKNMVWLPRLCRQKTWCPMLVLLLFCVCQQVHYNIPLLQRFRNDDDRDLHEEEVVHTLPVVFDNNFPWNDVDFNTQASCGVDKCFWPSVSNSTFGYLITAEGNYDVMLKSLQLANSLAQVCGIQHLYAPEPCVLVNVTTAHMERLHALAHNPSRHKVGRKSPFVFYTGDPCVAIQKVIVAPPHSLLYGTGGTKWQAMLQDMVAFSQQLQVPYATFKQNLLVERSKLQCALQTEMNYFFDFQALVDLRGNVFHIDLDAHFSRDPPTLLKQQVAIQEAIEDFNEFLQEFDDLLQPKDEHSTTS